MAYGIAYNPSAPVGQRLAPEVRTEIALLAPATVANGSITLPKLADGAVNEDKISPLAIIEEKLGDLAVTTAKVSPLAIIKEKLAAASIDHTKIDIGVPTVMDKDDQAISLRFVPLTAAEYAALTPDPNTVYLIS